MRIIIVEDEASIRNGMQQMIEKKTPHQVIATASDGVEGLEIIREYLPDVVISDIKMPRMDGLTMLEKLREEEIEIHALFLTGYSDFEYARTSLRLKAEDYLLKPVGVETLITALDKIDAKIRQRQEEEMSAQQLVLTVLGTNSGYEKMLPLLERSLQISEEEKIILILVRFCGDGEDPADRMRTETDILLKNSAFNRCDIFTLPKEREILLMFRDEHSQAYIRSFCLHQLASALRFEGELMFGCEEMTRLADLPQKVAEMESYFYYGFSAEKPVFLDRQTVESISFSPIEYPGKLETQIRKQIRMGNYDEVWSMGQQFEKEIIYSNGKPETIKEYTFRLMTVGIQAAELDVEKKIQDVFHMMIAELMHADTRLQLVERAQYIWNKVLENREGMLLSGENQTDNESVRIVAEMIRRNYAEDISLPGAAQAVGFTPEHLSRLFSREMGMTFSTYLTECRLDAAKRLLTEGNQKIYEVAKAVGYHDTKYFNRIFRAETGQTPMEYRRQSLWEK